MSRNVIERSRYFCKVGVTLKAPPPNCSIMSAGTDGITKTTTLRTPAARGAAPLTAGAGFARSATQVTSSGDPDVGIVKKFGPRNEPIIDRDREMTGVAMCRAGHCSVLRYQWANST